MNAPHKPTRGFTLIETLVALAVFSLVALTIIRLASENTRAAVHVENRLLAGIIAENVAVEAFASPNPPDRGLAQGGIAAVGQIQLLQPFMGLGLAALLLHEQVSWGMVLVTMAAVVCVAGAKKYAR